MYVLSKQLIGHNDDVRCVCTISDTTIATGSNDNTIKIWNTKTGELLQTFTKHTNFVTALTTTTTTTTPLLLPPSPDDKHPAEQHRSLLLLLSASYDGTVKAWNVDSLSDEPVLDIRAHSDKITSLWADDARGVLVTGSWDKTVRVWRGFQAARTLVGHSAAVFAVAVEPATGNIVSAADDNTVRIWSQEGDIIRVCSGTHSGRVRGLAPFGPGFLSCSNDLTVVSWDAAGNPLRTFSGHKSYVYGVSVPANISHPTTSSAGQPDDVFYSCGEDRTVLVWEDGAVKQGLVHPTSVWACTPLPNGDIVSCCGDGVVRIWTRDSTREVGPEEAEAYSAGLVSDVPSGAVGLSAGETALVPTVDQMTAEVGAYDGETRPFREGADVSIFRWDSRSFGWTRTWKVNFGRQAYQGKEYDVVFDVELDGRYFKLPFNVGENEYIVADKFLDVNGLDRCYLEDVAARLRSYNRSVMGGNNSDISTAAAPSQEAMTPPPQKQAARITRRNVTQTEYSLYVITDYGKVLAKLDPAAFTDADKEVIGEALRSEKGSVKPNVLAKMFACPPEAFLPVGGVLSMLVLHKKMSAVLSKYKDAAKNDVFDVALRTAAANPGGQVIPFRVFANALSNPVLAPVMEGRIQDIAKVSADAVLTSENELVKLSALSVFLNITLRFKGSINEEVASNFVRFYVDFLKNPKNSSPKVLEAAISGLGTLLYNNKSAAKAFAGIDEAAAVVKAFTESSDASLAELARAFSEMTF